MTSVVFVFLGGAFLVGILLLEAPALFTDTEAGIRSVRMGTSTVFRFTLYAAVAACFGAAAAALKLAANKLP